MKDDSTLTKSERQARAATMSGVEPADLSRFEEEGGRQVPEQRSEDERPAKTSAWKETVARYQKASVGRGVNGIAPEVRTPFARAPQRSSMNVACHGSQVASHSPLAGEE